MRAFTYFLYSISGKNIGVTLQNLSEGFLKHWMDGTNDRAVETEILNIGYISV
jgi:hypothetical protein